MVVERVDLVEGQITIKHVIPISDVRLQRDQWRYAIGIRATTTVWPPGKGSLPPQAKSIKGPRPRLLQRDEANQPVTERRSAHQLSRDSFRPVAWREHLSLNGEAAATGGDGRSWLRARIRNFFCIRIGWRQFRTVVLWPLFRLRFGGGSGRTIHDRRGGLGGECLLNLFHRSVDSLNERLHQLTSCPFNPQALASYACLTASQFCSVES